MNIALIFAGGSGVRMKNSSKPKQFLQLYGKEIIIHTIENFEKHPEIDTIVIVCIEEWIPFLKSLLDKYNIEKVRWIVSGGTTGQESIYKGLLAVKDNVPDDSVILVHDGVRPLINQKLISDCIESVLANGSAITITPEIETVVYVNKDDNMINKITDRSNCFHAKAPQCFRLSDIFNAHKLALADGCNNIIDSASLMNQYGYKLFTIQGEFENIKITTASDFYILRALYEVRENSQVFGV